MALGSSYNSNGGGNNRSYSNSNNQNNTLYNPTYYSRLSIRNPVDNLRLSFNYWNGTLRMSISEAGTAQDGRNNELAYIHLSPTKARLFATCVDRIITNPESSNIFGVDTGTGETRGMIAIGRDMGKPYLVIAKVNANGQYESNQRFNFNMNYQYLLQINDISKLGFKKEYDDSLELNQLKDLLEDYARYASGAAAYFYHDIGRYEAARSSNLIRKIGEKVGAIDKNYNGGGGSNNSFFSSASNEYSEPSSNGNKANTGRNAYKSITNLEDELG